MSSFGCFVRELVGNLRFDTEKELSVPNEIRALDVVITIDGCCHL
jgi:hypothetical protein